MKQSDIATSIGPEFTSEVVSSGGSDLHYVTGGEGPAIVLIHGFPQDWLEWRHMMPALARRFTVIAVDLPGVGASTARAGMTFDADALADDIDRLVAAKGPAPVHLVGHDVGAWVAYAMARRNPGRVRTATLIESPVPGVEPWSDLPARVPLWHPAFHMVDRLPEDLVEGRQEIYFSWFFETFTTVRGAVEDDAVRHYADAYGDRAALSAAFGMYRALPVTAAVNAVATGPVAVPLLLVGSETLFAPIMPDLAKNLRDSYGWAEVDVEAIADGGHYLPEERPEKLVALIERHTSRDGR